MKELVVISGKGGSGKTSLTAAFVALAERPVIADCDVDAADLHLVLAPRVKEHHDFLSGHEAVIRQADCVKCGGCLAHCRFGAVKMDGKRAGEATFTIDPVACEGCGVCVRFCPVQAIDFTESLCGDFGNRLRPHVPCTSLCCRRKLGETCRHRAARSKTNCGKRRPSIDYCRRPSRYWLSGHCVRDRSLYGTGSHRAYRIRGT